MMRNSESELFIVLAGLDKKLVSSFHSVRVYNHFDFLGL